MPEPEPSAILILLGTCSGLLALIFLVCLGIRAQLSRLERLLALKPEAKAPVAPPVTTESNTGGMFEAFLAEEPERKLLSKKEQAAVYRKWRQEKGMNWSKP